MLLSACCAVVASLRVAERLDAKRVEREVEQKRLDDEAARLAKQRMFAGCVLAMLLALGSWFP